MMTTLAAWLHDLDPYFIELWPGGPIRWYGLAYLAGFLAAYLLIRRVVRKGISPVKPDRVGDLVIAGAFGVVIGGRVGYALFYQPVLFISFSEHFPFWDLLAINKGGMASHGGMLGLMIAIAWHARRHHLPWLHLMDLTAFTMPVGIFFGRVANFVNGELLGRPCAADFPLAVKFPQEIDQLWIPEQYDQLMQQLGSLVPPKVDVAAWVVRQVQEGNEAVIRIVEPLLTPRHPSQLYQATLEGLMLLLILAVYWRKPRKPGLVFAVFGIGYCLVRIVGESFRLPDTHIENQEFALWHITRGQLLSGAFLLIGVTIVTVSLVNKAAPLGGWRRAKAGNPSTTTKSPNHHITKSPN